MLTTAQPIGIHVGNTEPIGKVIALKLDNGPKTYRGTGTTMLIPEI